MGNYEYADHIDGNQLRILTLEPSGDENAIVTCTLSTVSRDTCGSYEALSYVWGTDKPSNSIVVNGLTFLVTSNLASALQHIRLPDSKRRLWIDAICINQKSNLEKSEQVALMGETYSRCSRMLAWLGNASDEEQSTLAMETIRVRGTQFTGRSLVNVYSSSTPWPMEISGVNPDEYLLAIKTLLQRPWFTRLWVFQEVCLAPQIEVICGHEVVRWVDFTNFQVSLPLCPEILRVNSKLHTIGPQEAILWLPLLGLIDLPLLFTRQAIQVTQEELLGNGNVNSIRRNACVLLKLLWTTRNRRCEKAQDRFYALRNIALDIDRNILFPKYDDDLGVTYAKTTLAMISYSENLNILSLCRGLESADPESIRSPSWSLHPNLNVLDASGLKIGASLVNVIGRDVWFDIAPNSIAQPRHSTDFFTMIVNGYDIGIIDESSSVQWLNGSIQRARMLVEARALDRADQTSTEVFWRTLITNRAADNSSAKAEVEGVEFEPWWDLYSHPTEQMNSRMSSVDHFNRAYYRYGLSRAVFTTDTDLIGIGQQQLSVGDHICLLAGAQAPFILRPQAENYQVVGEAYIHSGMNGERWNELRNKGTPLTEFSLI